MVTILSSLVFCVLLPLANRTVPTRAPAAGPSAAKTLTGKAGPAGLAAREESKISQRGGKRARRVQGPGAEGGRVKVSVSFEREREGVLAFCVSVGTESKRGKGGGTYGLW